jgi:hypothetical protein
MHRARMVPGICIMVAAWMLSGCYPALLTSRPRTGIIVTDESGAPLESATVTLGTMKRHGIVGRYELERFLTNRDGRVQLRKRFDWKVQVMLPDAGVSYSWALCVSKPGFEAVPMVFVDFDEPIKVSMYASAVRSECQWHPYENTPRVPEREARWIEVEGGEWLTHGGFAMILDEKIRAAMETSARQQGIVLRPWSEYRFQYQARGTDARDRRLFVHAICRAPADFDLTRSFFSEPDDTACFFDTTYTNQIYSDQPPSAFTPLRLVASPD